MRRAVWDIEGNGLLPTITVVHCLTVCVLGETPILYVGRNVSDGLNVLNTCDEVIGHNIIGYDLPALWLTLRWKLLPHIKVTDTLIWCQLLEPDNLQGHSLEEWGKRLGELKGDYVTWCKENGIADPWAEYRPEMGTYNIQDVRINIQLLHFIEAKVRAYRGTVDWEQAARIEHQFAKDFAVQAMRGVQVDVPLALRYSQEWAAEMDRLSDAVEPLLPAKPCNKGELEDLTPKGKFKKDGTPDANMLKWWDKIEQRHLDCNPGEPAGSCGKEPGWYGNKEGRWFKLPHVGPLATHVSATLADQEHIKNVLMEAGWVPTIWNYKKAIETDRKTGLPRPGGKMRIVKDGEGKPIRTQPKLADKGVLCENLEKMPEGGIGRDVAKWVVYRHRLGLINSILNACRADGRVSATGMSLGTPTARVTHQVVANIPKADKTVTLGAECRSIFTATLRRGHKLGGVDADGLELRMLAHYMNDPEFTRALLEGKKEDGTDIHSVLCKAGQPHIKDRNMSKTLIYGMIYGAGDEKLGQTAQAPDTRAATVGGAIRDLWMARFPKLADFVEAVAQEVKKHKGVIAVDGRLIPCRSQHSAPNTKLQSAGSICVKVATCYMNKKIREERLLCWQVIHMHDEVQLDGLEPAVRRGCELFIEGLKYAERLFKLNCPLAGNYSIGDSWAETH
ncbi:MAG: DNA polymerase [Sulfuritalea sp.]|nr:DNA polymerase [Sulfuritalea sp.]